MAQISSIRGIENRTFYRRLCTIGIPMTVQFFLSSSLNLIDTVMVGRLGERAVAAVGAANQLYYILTFLMTGIASGCGIFISQYHGKGDSRRIRHALGTALILSIAVGSLFFFTALLIPEQVAEIFIKEKAFVRDTASYLQIVCFSYLLAAITSTYTSGMKNIGRAVPSMPTSMTGVLVNVALNWMLIFGKCGFPRLEIRGAAIATLIARCVELAVILVVVYGGKTVFAVSAKELFSFERNFFRQLLRPTTHTVANELIWSVGVSAYAVAYGKLGETALAVAQVYQTIQSFLSILFYGIASAAIIMVGEELGAGRMDVAQNYGKRMVRLSICLGVACGVLMFFGAELFARLFSLPVETTWQIIRTLRILALPFVAFCVNTVVITGVLRSGGDTKVPLMIETVLIWCCGIPLTFVACLVLKTPVYLAVLATYIWEVPKLLILLRRMRRGSWIKDVTDNISQSENNN